MTTMMMSILAEALAGFFHYARETSSYAHSRFHIQFDIKRRTTKTTPSTPSTTSTTTENSLADDYPKRLAGWPLVRHAAYAYNSNAMRTPQ